MSALAVFRIASQDLCSCGQRIALHRPTALRLQWLRPLERRRLQCLQRRHQLLQRSRRGNLYSSRCHVAVIGVLWPSGWLSLGVWASKLPPSRSYRKHHQGDVGCKLWGQFPYLCLAGAHGRHRSQGLDKHGFCASSISLFMRAFLRYVITKLVFSEPIQPKPIWGLC